MAIVYNRKTGETFEGSGPASGVYGQISMSRLCETLEAIGEIKSNEKITHLAIAGKTIRYRVETRP